jgi:hypothetical protein
MQSPRSPSRMSAPQPDSMKRRMLAAKGVKFEHHDLPDTTRAGDVHLSGDVQVAWFKDLDGNILSIVNR